MRPRSTGLGAAFDVAVTLGRLATSSRTHPHAVRADYEERRDQLVAVGAPWLEAEAAALAYVVDKFSDLAARKQRPKDKP